MYSYFEEFQVKKYFSKDYKYKAFLCKLSLIIYIKYRNNHIHKMRIFSIPREHGITSIWFSSLVYSLLQVKEINLLFLTALSGSLILLLSSDYLLLCTAYRHYLKCSVSIGILSAIYLPIIINKFNYSIPPLVIILLLYILILHYIRGGKPVTYGSTIVGGGLISTHTIFILIASNVTNISIYFFPIIYSIMATAQASLKVMGYVRIVAFIYYIMLSMILIYVVILFGPLSIYTIYIVVIDVVSRVVQEILNVSANIAIKTYGIIEFIRTFLVLLSLGLVLR